MHPELPWGEINPRLLRKDPIPRGHQTPGDKGSAGRAGGASGSVGIQGIAPGMTVPRLSRPGLLGGDRRGDKNGLKKPENPWQ